MLTCANHYDHYQDDCLECIKQNAYEPYFKKFPYADNAEGKPGDFIGGKLVAIKPVDVYTAPDGTKIKTVSRGDVGVIESFVTRDGIVWWMLTDKKFVKHATGFFDVAILEKSLADLAAKRNAEVKELVDKRLAANDNPLYKTGKAIESGLDILPDLDTIKWFLIVVAIIVVILLLSKILGK